MLFTFPSRYWSTIGLSGVFSLAGWSRRIRAEFLVLRVTQDAARPRLASVTGLSPSKVGLSRTFSSRYRYHNAVLQPRICVATHAVWALPRSLATTGGITFCFLFLRVLRCFSSPGSPPAIRRDGSPSDCRVAPFGHPGVTGRLHLTPAFRSLPRPSSPSRAKASAVRP